MSTLGVRIQSCNILRKEEGCGGTGYPMAGLHMRTLGVRIQSCNILRKEEGCGGTGYGMAGLHMRTLGVRIQSCNILRKEEGCGGRAAPLQHNDRKTEQPEGPHEVARLPMFRGHKYLRQLSLFFFLYFALEYPPTPSPAAAA